MKIAVAKPVVVEHRIWCDRCCIRIAPSEEQTAVDGKVFHPACYSKLHSKKSKATH